MKVTTFNVKNTFSNDGIIKMLTGLNAVNQCLKVLILTQRNELLGDPEFGSILQEKSFNLMNTILKDILIDNLTRLIIKYDHRIAISNIDISYIDTSTVQIDIEYSIGSNNSRLNMNILMKD
jgi:phage baseplate assembly protein W